MNAASLIERATCQAGRTPSSRRQVLSKDTVAKTDKGLTCNGFRGLCPRKASECDYLMVGACEAAQPRSRDIESIDSELRRVVAFRRLGSGVGRCRR